MQLEKQWTISEVGQWNRYEIDSNLLNDFFESERDIYFWRHGINLGQIELQTILHQGKKISKKSGVCKKFGCVLEK